MTSRLILAVLLWALAASTAAAQDPTGTIEGSITDPSAAVIAGARVAARNLDTGFTREATTAPDGFYRLPLLPVGRYSMTVEAPRFAIAVREAIQLNVNQTLRLNVQMEVSGLTETLTVAVGAPLVET